MATMKILLVEDDEPIRTALGMFLTQEGYTVIGAESGEEGLAAFERQPADIVLVDLMLPGIDGFETTRRLRRQSTVPVIIVTARDDSYDVVAGLEAGADDYVTKPVFGKVLSARIRALLRRASEFSSPTVWRFGDLEISRDAGVVRKGERDVSLTRTEFQLLCELASKPGWVFSRANLLETVWGYDYFGDSRLVDIHISRLRNKIEDDPSNPAFVLTVRGMGYKLQP